MSDELQDFQQFVKGREDVSTPCPHGATSVEPDGDGKVEVIHTAASCGIAYWVGRRRAKVKTNDTLKATPMDVRITEVFRREGTGWKFVHRYANMLATEGNLK